MFHARKFATLTALLVLVGCSLGPSIKGSGVAKTETREVGKFTRIEVAGAADVVIDVDATKPQSVTIAADDNILPIVETVVRDGTLVISTKQNYSSRLGVKATITLASLNGAGISGSSNITARNVSGDSFDTHISGSGNVIVSGTATRVQISVAGSGNVDLSNLAAVTGAVSVAGSGDVKVNASDSLDATVSGSGGVRYTGRPKVSTHISGSGSVNPM